MIWVVDVYIYICVCVVHPPHPSPLISTHTKYNTAKVGGTGPSALHLAISALGVPASTTVDAEEVDPSARAARKGMVALLLEHGPRIFRCVSFLWWM